MTGWMAETKMSGAALLETARVLAPRIAAAADRIELERRLPLEVVHAMADAGLFRMLVPRSLGGGEMDLATYANVVEEVAKADGSTAWCLSQAAGTAAVAARLGPDGAREIFGSDPRSIVAWGPPREARAITVEAGYRVTGRWTFASGCRHATWLGGFAPIYEQDGHPVLAADGTHDGRTMLFPAADGEIIDVWHVSGLRGTGSDDIAASDLFVPCSRTVHAQRDPPREPGPLYAFSLTSLYATGFASVALGIVRTMLDAFIEFAGAKRQRGVQDVLRENAVVQSQVAQAEAHLRSARAFLHETIGDVWSAVGSTGALTVAQRIQIRLATTHAIHLATQAADLVYHAAGADAILARQPFERRFRDVHAVRQQVQGRQAHYEAVGRFLLGLDPATTFL